MPGSDPLLEGVEWRHPSPRLLWLRRFEVAFATVAAAVLLAVFTKPYLAAAPVVAGLVVGFFLQRRGAAGGEAGGGGGPPLPPGGGVAGLPGGADAGTRFMVVPPRAPR